MTTISRIFAREIGLGWAAKRKTILTERRFTQRTSPYRGFNLAAIQPAERGLAICSDGMNIYLK